MSSIASSIFSQTRSFYSLRSAIDERFVPVAIRNLKLTSYVLFVVLVALYSTWFGIQLQLNTQMQQNVLDIKYSEGRVRSLIDLNLRV